MSDILLSMKNISKEYGKGSSKTITLENVDFSVKRGEFVGILGTSGSGKTTLLNILGCMDKATTGNYAVNGNLVDKMTQKDLARIRNQTFGFIVQDYALLEHCTVYKNVEMPLVYGKKRDKKERVEKILEELGIAKKAQELVCNLSGGQKQRVAIARALVNEADIILADEPTGALDSKNGNQVVEILKKLNENGKTIIMVTHDKNIAKSCQRIVEIEDGKIVTSDVKC